MKQYVLILLFYISSIFSYAALNESLPQSLDNTLDKLDMAISQRDSYMHKQLQPIDSLKSQIGKVDMSHLPQLYEEIGDKYRRCNIDSALRYYTKGVEASKISNNLEMEQRLLLSRTALLPVQGIVKEAIEI